MISKLLFGLSYLMVLLSGLLLLLGHQGYGLRFIVYGFYGLFIASIVYIWEARNEK